MLETNLRLVGSGLAIRLAVRAAKVEGTDTSPELLQKVCGRLRHRHGLAAVPDPRATSRLLVATRRPLEPLQLVDDSWEIEMRDAGLPEEWLTLTSDMPREVLPQLVERAFLATLAGSSHLRMYGSPRIWYEPDPFTTAEGIAAYRRYEVSAQRIDGVGIVLAVDVGTAFFTTESLAYFFDSHVSDGERRRREQRLEELLGRQEGHKGTLRYDTDTTLTSCYFVKAPPGVTCSGTGRIRRRGTTYASLADYNRAHHPAFGNTDDLAAVQVSFPMLENAAVWVVAERLQARVMNEQLPHTLAQVDKCGPGERRMLLTAFWDQLGPRPLGRIGQNIAPAFWRPADEHIRRYTPVALAFGHDQELLPPGAATPRSYREHYGQRLEFLHRAGVYSMPAGVDSQLACAYPSRLPSDLAELFSEDLVRQLTCWTGRTITIAPVAYSSVAQAIEQLQQRGRGEVVFILNDEPGAYFEVEFHLDGWRVKRLTEDTLYRKDREHKSGAWDGKLRKQSVDRGRRNWEQFITMCALDVVQKLDGIPWRINRLGLYEAMLTVDVGREGRFFAVSLLIARDKANTPSFRLVTRVQAKLDRLETINPVLLQDELVKLVQETMGSDPDPLGALLVLRDGRTVGQEQRAISGALDRLHNQGLISDQAKIDLVDLHKESEFGLRLWEVDATGRVDNPLEGTVLALNGTMLALTTTGQATLHQGTAEPLILQGQNVLDAAEAVCAATHLNWDSPTMSQRLPLPVRRTDEELRSREAQEIRRLR